MKRRDLFLKQFIVVLLLICISLPMLQYLFNIVAEPPLNGAIRRTPKPDYSNDALLNGTYKEENEKWLNEQFGFRNFLVRFYNQVHYSLFDKTTANGTIIGKDNYLFEYNFIDALNGNDLLSEEEMEYQIRQFKALQDSLSLWNKTMLVTFAAGKASFYTEYIPEKYVNPSPVSNYLRYSKKLPEAGVHTIDFNNWLIQKKKSSPYSLFPKAGAHWSEYASLLVLDSLIKRLEVMRGEDLPSVIIERVETESEARGTDNDMGIIMNLMQEIKGNFAYPVFRSEDTEGKKRLKLLVIGDSFFWPVYNKTWGHEFFKYIEFRYYNREMDKSDKGKGLIPCAADWREKLKQFDVVLFLVSEANLKRFPWGFTDMILGSLQSSVDPDSRQGTLDKIEFNVRNDPRFMKELSDKANNEDVDFDTIVKQQVRTLMGEID